MTKRQNLICLCFRLLLGFGLLLSPVVILNGLSVLKPRNSNLIIDVGQDSSERDCQEHARNTPDLSAYNKENKNEERRYIECRTKELGLDDIAVDKLQGKREYEPYDDCVRLCKKQDNGKDKCSDKT